MSDLDLKIKYYNTKVVKVNYIIMFQIFIITHFIFRLKKSFFKTNIYIFKFN